jgi:ribosomal protein L32
MSNKTVTDCPSCGQQKTIWHDCCANCGAELTHVFDTGNRQYVDALEVILSGGYGMFFDNIDGDHRVFLCCDCAQKLCEAYPWIDRLVGRGHS